MTVYLVSYDLINETSGYDYQPLWNELNRLGAHKTQYSLWLVDLSNSHHEVQEHFKQFVDSDDRLWVTRLRPNEFTYSNARNGTKDWLRRNPPS